MRGSVPYDPHSLILPDSLPIVNYKQKFQHLNMKEILIPNSKWSFLNDN